MSKTIINTNNGSRNTNLNQIFGRGGRGQGGSGNRARGDCSNGRGNNSIAKYSFEGKMKDGCISKIKITETRHRATQYKKIIDTLPVLCVDKNYQGIDDVTWTGNDLVEVDFMPLYLDANQWSTTHHVQISTVNPLDVPAADDSRSARFEIMEQTHVFDENLQKELLSEYKCNFKKSPKSTPSSLQTRSL